jgi:DNA helicase TIP49 (TBP-interacting protein)
MEFKSIEDVISRLESVDYIPSREIATVVFLAAATKKPILVEGPAGGGKTELARAVARCLGREKIRLQCYEGLDEAKALYEWEYAKQLLYTQMIKEKINDVIAGANSIAETLDWAQSLMVLNIESLSKQAVSDTLNVICKHRVDAQLVRNSMDQVLSDD